MNNDELIARLMRELAVTQMILAALVVNKNCTASQPHMNTVSMMWMSRAKKYCEQEWCAVAAALTTYMKVKDPKNAQAALENLHPLDEKYQENGGGKKVYLSEVTTAQESALFEKATHILRQQYIPKVEFSTRIEPEVHGATMGAFGIFKHLLIRGKQYLLEVYHGRKIQTQ